MNKKRMTFSLITLIGSLFLFVIASFAWFAISEIIDLGDINIDVKQINVSATLYVSDNGSDYVLATNIDFNNSVPGDVKYYKIVVNNNNSFAVNTSISLRGFTDGVADLSGDDTNYLAGRSLMDVLLINSSNNVDSNTIVNQSMSSLLFATDVYTHNSVTISPSSSAELYLSFTVSPSLAGSDYQNLKLDIDSLIVHSAD